jgi:hypothetical protein
MDLPHVVAINIKELSVGKFTFFLEVSVSCNDGLLPSLSQQFALYPDGSPLRLRSLTECYSGHEVCLGEPSVFHLGFFKYNV